YTAADGVGASATATVQTTVLRVNDAPTAVNDSDTVAEDGSVTTTVLANDSAGPANENQALTVTAVTQGTNGTVTTNGTTTTYTPDRKSVVQGKNAYTIAGSDGDTA